MTKEMYAAQVKNWLMDLATGVKASRKKVQFAPAERDAEWEVTATCYDEFEDGCGIHKLKELAEALDIQPKFYKFKKGEFFNDMYPGYWYIELFEVRFYDLCREGEEENEKEFAN